MRKNNFIYITITTALLFLAGCKKQDEWLDVKYNKGDVVPESLEDFQALLDNIGNNNTRNISYGIMACDNHYVPSTALQNAQKVERNSYCWLPDIFDGSQSVDWTNAYRVIMYANVVLEGLSEMEVDNTDLAAYNIIKGDALYRRANEFYDLLQTFAKPYIAGSAASDLGIPLRTTADVSVHFDRATVAECYQKIINDLKDAETLLPVFAANKWRPSRVTVWALLAKTYLNMEDYESAWLYADKALNEWNALLDFNSSTVNPSANIPFPNFRGNMPEVIYYRYLGTYSLSRANGIGIVDTALFNSYDPNDLRRTLYYRVSGNPAITRTFRGTFTGLNNLFSGVATNELYLIRSESQARLDHITEAINDLNTLLVTRWRTGTFVPFHAATREEALTLILDERRKELPFTSQIRWEDLRRLNKDPDYAVTLTRNIDGTIYTLPPNDPRYVYPLPDDEIRLNRLEQNPR